MSERKSTLDEERDDRLDACTLEGTAGTIENGCAKAPLLADAEGGENLIQDLVGGGFAGERV